MTAPLRHPCLPTADVCTATLPRLHVAGGEGEHECIRAARHAQRLADRHECACGVAWPVEQAVPAPTLLEIMGRTS